MTYFINTETLQYPLSRRDIEQEYPATKPTDPFEPPPIFVSLLHKGPEFNGKG